VGTGVGADAVAPQQEVVVPQENSHVVLTADMIWARRAASMNVRSFWPLDLNSDRTSQY
jgi:hypothetical protein